MMLQAVPPVRADSLRTVIDSVFSARDYRWESRENPFGVVRRVWLALQRWLFDLQLQNPQLFRVLLWSLVAVLIAIILHAAWVAVQTVRAASRREGRSFSSPQLTPRDARWYAVEAGRLAAQGHFPEAMQADFLRLMLELDARRVTHFHASKTPGEYVREASLPDERRKELRELVRMLYSYAFARIPCGRADFDLWRERAVADRYAPAH
ncbi:MAG: hypothetical protein ABIT38_02430 [Gemmatimonadaceae bacterium]